MRISRMRTTGMCIDACRQSTQVFGYQGVRNAICFDDGGAAAGRLAPRPPAPARHAEIQWSAAGQFTHQSSVPAGKFLEVCDKVPAGVKVQWDFEADAPVDFNVHFHVGKDVIFPTKLSAVTQGKDTLVAKFEQDYCWMWTNKSAVPAMLVLRLQR